MNLTGCRYCYPLPCTPATDYHLASKHIHWVIREQASHYWATDLEHAQTEAKKLWKARRSQKPDYRVEEEKVTARVRKPRKRDMRKSHQKKELA